MGTPYKAQSIKLYFGEAYEADGHHFCNIETRLRGNFFTADVIVSEVVILF